MGSLMDRDVSKDKKDTVFTDTYAEVVAFYTDYDIEQWEEAGMLVIKNTKSDVGLRDNSDVICVYDKETGLPVIVTERIFKGSMSAFEWWKRKRIALKTIKYEPRLFDLFDVRVTFGSDYIDFIYSKGDWERCLGDLLSKAR